MPQRDYYLPSRGLTSQANVARIESNRVPRSKFVTAYNRKTTGNAGVIYPFLVREVVPGDHFQFNAQAYARMATLSFPLMDDQRFDTHWFFVPTRILWDNWTKMMGEQINPGDSIAFTVPQVVSPAGGFSPHTLYDHFGIPCVGQIAVGQTITISAIPLRAYNSIFNNWYRDENLVTSAAINTGNGPDNYADYNLKVRAKTHDYFTSALPWTQKFTAPLAPLSGYAPVAGIGLTAFVADAAGLGVYDSAHAGTLQAYPHGQTGAISASQIAISTSTAGGPNLQISADLSGMASGSNIGNPGLTINGFRNAMAIQVLMERDARGGTRYTEMIRSHFDVINPDFRLQRPEYIGGGQTPLNITPIAQTGTGGGGLAALGGTGTLAGQHRASYAATEYGYIIGLWSIKSNISYSQGLHKLWSRTTRYDFYIPELDGLGEQAIIQKELYMNGDPTNDELVFGYIPRWEEYRTNYSRVTGLFNPRTASNIAQWVLTQNFNPAPSLNNVFIEDRAGFSGGPVERAVLAGASTNNQQYLIDIHVQEVAVRPMSAYGTPTQLNRM